MNLIAVLIFSGSVLVLVAEKSKHLGGFSQHSDVINQECFIKADDFEVNETMVLVIL